MPQVRRAWNVLRWYAPAILLGVAPLMTVIGANLGTVPLRGVVVARSLLAAAGAVVVLIWALRVFQRDLAARVAWLCWFLILFNLYGASAQGLRSVGLAISATDPLFAVPYVLTAGVVAAIASRPWEVRARDPLPLTMTAVLLLGVGLVPTAWENRRPDLSWRESADRFVASALLHPTTVAPAEPRDIYYIVLDGLGRADTLRRLHGLDLSPFVTALRRKGFYVAAEARTNYSQTFLSLASTLNMTYLDDLATAVGTQATTRDPLAYVIQENALMRLASRAGYRIVTIGSDFMGTQKFVQADVCVCLLSGLDELELAALALTPLAAVSLDPLKADPYDIHRRRVLDTFAALETPALAEGRSLVFAHALAPHPPFVFARDGSPRRPDRRYTTSDAHDFPGSEEEYVNGYGEQAQFIMRRLMTTVDSLLSRPGPAPVIVIHGDHGPKSAKRPDITNARETMDIFAAYYFPDAAAALYPTITPVNAARVLASRYLGVELPRLPDQSFYSRWEQPYKFIPDSPVPVAAAQDSMSPARIP